MAGEKVITFDAKPPAAVDAVKVDDQTDAAKGTYSRGDVIKIKLSEEIDASRITLADFALSAGSLGSTDAAGNPTATLTKVFVTGSNRWANEFHITLGDSPVLSQGATITLDKKWLIDRNNNTETSNDATWTVPDITPPAKPAAVTIGKTRTIDGNTVHKTINFDEGNPLTITGGNNTVSADTKQIKVVITDSDGVERTETANVNTTTRGFSIDVSVSGLKKDLTVKLYAVDAAGNLSEAREITGVTYDGEKPTNQMEQKITVNGQKNVSPYHIVADKYKDFTVSVKMVMEAGQSKS